MKKLLAVFIIVLCMSFFTFPGFGQKLKIMPLGNSITFDDNSGPPRSIGEKIAYRYRLYQLLTGAGYTFDYVGSEQSGGWFLPESPIDSLNYTDNAGIPGAKTNGLIDVLNEGYDPNPPYNCLLDNCPSEYLPEFDPDVILLHIGTNDIAQSVPASTIINNIASILNIIDAYEAFTGKTIPVFLAQIISQRHPGLDCAAADGPTTTLNNNLEILVNNRPGDEIILVDMEGTAAQGGAGLCYIDTIDGGDMVDQLHPGPSGYNKMGEKWFEAMEGYNIKPPVVSDIPNCSIYEGTPYIEINLNNYVFDPQEADEDITWSYTPYPSSHYNISFADGIAKITLKVPDWCGSETLTFKAEDSGNGGTPEFDTDEVTIYSIAVNDTPVIRDREPFYVNEDSQITITLDSLEVIDPDNIYPDDFTLHIQPGSNYTIISNYTVRPNANYHGSLTVPMYVDDGQDNSATKNMTVIVNSVNDNPWLNIPSQRTVNEDVLYNKTITTGDNDVEDVLTLSKVEPFPSWLTFNTGTGQLYGTPDNDDVGNHTVTIRVNDTHINVDSTFNIEVINVNDLPIFTSFPEDTVILTYEEFEYFVVAIDIDPTNDLLIYEVTEKPNWLGFDPILKKLSAIPTKNDTGIFPVEIRVFDGIGYSYQNFDLTVELTNHPPEITSTAQDTAYEDVLYVYAIKATDKENDPLTYTGVTIPGWSNFYASGVLMGTPDESNFGEYEVILSVSDGENIVYDSFNISVVENNDKPVILGTTRPLNTPKETPLKVSLGDLEVEDDDNIYPDDFTLKLQNGSNYTVIDSFVIPYTGYTGILKVGVIVNDGIIDSDEAEIDVGVGTTSIFNHSNENSIIKLVYPNPAKDYVYFQFKNNHEQAIISFLDCSMKLIKKVIIPEETVELRIDINEFISGIVFYKIDYQNIYYSGKLLIK